MTWMGIEKVFENGCEKKKLRGKGRFFLKKCRKEKKKKIGRMEVKENGKAKAF